MSQPHEDEHLSRRKFLQRAALAGVAASAAPALAVSAGDRAGGADEPVPGGLLTGSENVDGIPSGATHLAGGSTPGPDPEAITELTVAEAEKLADLAFTPEQRQAMIKDLQDRLEVLKALHAQDIPNSLVPAHVFDPRIGGDRPPAPEERPVWDPAAGPMAKRPATDEDLAFQPVHVLAGLLKTRGITSLELTRLYLSRLKQYDPVLHCVIHLTEERALAQARAADAELDAGLWRGPLHGVPWGAKDLLSVRGYPTTWGAMPYKDQVIDADAEVVRRLDAAGAVLVAKLTTGALAWGDVWFGGMTRNPWNIEQGSSGSSAGPGSAVAAGLVGFAIGSETLGSIVSPSTRNGVSGLRPTFGRISRAGAMTLAWSLDKLGPMCRSAFDCGLVLDAVHGVDDDDPGTLAADFRWPAATPRNRIRLGYVADAMEGDYNGAEADRSVLDVLRNLGYDPRPMNWPARPTGAMMLTLGAETAAAFDYLTRSGGTDSMVRQDLWPASFRESRFITAVDYLNGQRERTLLMREMSALMSDFDVVVTNHRRNGLSITNLTGHPSVTVPNRFSPLDDAPPSSRRRPDSINFIGGLWKDELALAVAHDFQSATDFHLQRPPIQ